VSSPERRQRGTSDLIGSDQVIERLREGVDVKSASSCETAT
jgi:hypothetical protein